MEILAICIGETFYAKIQTRYLILKNKYLKINIR